MEQLHFITKLLDIKDPNIQILDIINKDTHKEIIAKLDYDAPSCPECGNQLKKYDFQKPSKIPYLETTGMPTRILLRKRRFKCYHCSKMMVAETPLVKKNHRSEYQKRKDKICPFSSLAFFQPTTVDKEP
ncbi:transposase [Streptococcus pneumoniae]|nr:transposase [Streptococcus pneumoniae]